MQELIRSQISWLNWVETSCQEISRLQSESDKFRHQVQAGTFSVAHLKLRPDKDKQFLDHTGIRSAVLFDWVVELVQPAVIPIHGITIENQVLLTRDQIKEEHQSL